MELDGGGGVCGNGALDPVESCDDGDLVDGDGCSSICEVEARLRIFGVAAGGSVSMTILGEVVVVFTTLGDSASDVAAALAAAIAANSTLASMGVHASADGDSLVTSGPS